MSNATDGIEFLIDFLGGINNIGHLLDLSNLPSKMREIEHKYRLPVANGCADGGLLEFVTNLKIFLGERKAHVRTVLFAGIDQYYVMESHNGLLVTFRFRTGLNKLPELTAKFAHGDNGNVIRGEINLDVRHNPPDVIRGFLTIVTKFAARSSQFAIRQDGLLFKIQDPEHGKLEIVNYQVGGISPPKPSVALAEIESKLRDAEAAVKAILAYEAGLGLTDLRCQESIAELFAPVQVN